MDNQKITVLCITVISLTVVGFGAEYAKDIIIATVAGLVGYLSGDKE